MRTVEETLRSCPTCGSTDNMPRMRGRDFQWCADLLPGRVGPTDVDFVLHQARTGRWLVVEFKSEKYVPKGQQLLFDFLVQNGAHVYIVLDQDWDKGQVSVGRWWMSKPVSWETMTVEGLRTFVQRWWELEDC